MVVLGIDKGAIRCRSQRISRSCERTHLTRRNHCDFVVVESVSFTTLRTRSVVTNRMIARVNVTIYGMILAWLQKLITTQPLIIKHITNSKSHLTSMCYTFGALFAFS